MSNSSQSSYDLVLAGGTVIDPASGTNARLDVAVSLDRSPRHPEGLRQHGGAVPLAERQRHSDHGRSWRTARLSPAPARGGPRSHSPPHAHRQACVVHGSSAP